MTHNLPKDFGINPGGAEFFSICRCGANSSVRYRPRQLGALPHRLTTAGLYRPSHSTLRSMASLTMSISTMWVQQLHRALKGHAPLSPQRLSARMTLLAAGPKDAPGGIERILNSHTGAPDANSKAIDDPYGTLAPREKERQPRAQLGHADLKNGISE